MAAAPNASEFVPQPDKFAADCDITMYFLQFELFLQLAAVPEANQLKVLLANLDLPVFQATVTSLNMETATYSDVKNFLQTRYSTHDAYMEHLNFFESKFSIPAGSYAASLSSLMDKFSADAAQLREEILVAKFISSCKGTLSSELRLRRPTTLNDYVKITISLSTVMSSSACAVASSKPCDMNKRYQKPVPNGCVFAAEMRITLL